MLQLGEEKGQKGSGMERNNSFNHFVRNPQTHAKHRRESFWQITFPLIIGILVILAAVVGIIISATQPTTELRRWADLSLMWMILPSLFFAFLILVILIGLVYGISVLSGAVPRYAAIALFYMQVVEGKVRQISDKLAEPFIKTNSTWAAARWIGKRSKRAVDER